MNWRWNRQYQEASTWKRLEMEIARADMEMDEANDRRAEREFLDAKSSGDSENVGHSPKTAARNTTDPVSGVKTPAHPAN